VVRAAEVLAAGLQDDGAGNLRVVLPITADTGNQSVTSAFHLTQRAATGALTYTLARANTLFNGFGFWVSALTASITFAINAADAFSGGATGGSMIIPPGTQAWVSTDGQNSGTWYLTLTNSIGLNSPLNLQLNATVAGNALTIAIKDRNGNDPTTASPVLVAFRDPTAANGDPVLRAITSALSITVSSTATLGAVNNQANRIWVAVFDNAGASVLGVYNSLNSTGPSILPWDETSPASGTAIAGGSNNAQTFYTASGVTSKAFRIIGYLESVQAIAGTWATPPSKVQLFGPGIKRPGDTVQELYNKLAGTPTTTSATFVALTSQNAAISPQSAANLIRIEGMGSVGIGQSGVNQSIDAKISLSRGTTANTNLLGNPSINHLDEAGGGATIGTNVTIPFFAYDTPNTTASTTYAIQATNSLGLTTTFSNGSMVLREIQT